MGRRRAILDFMLLVAGLGKSKSMHVGLAWIRAVWISELIFYKPGTKNPSSANTAGRNTDTLQSNIF